MKVVYQSVFLGEDYLKSPEWARIEIILKKYGPEYPYEANPDLYAQIFNRFLESPYGKQISH
jgi:hypothetical protein